MHASQMKEHLHFVLVACGFQCGRWKARYVSELFSFSQVSHEFVKRCCLNMLQLLLSIDAQLQRVSYSCAYKDTNFKVLSAPHGETKAKNINHCPNVCESCGQFIRTNLLKN